jgi:putative membrane protein
VPFAIRLLIAWLINIAALWLADALFDGVTIDGWGPLLIAAAVLGIVNTLVKPVLTFLSIPFIIVTLGLFLLLINIARLALTDWIVGDFDISGFWAYVGTVIVAWAVNVVAGSLLDLERGGRRY